ncbi:TadE/TadG family type IV pilus assembly protein [Sphingomonas faeni]|uniref:TadE/TadG family type IV pilus assembly protein n=1 Tax=Sphingomonas faeni TaxID=185950 RepID=UPI00335BF9B5
MSIRRDRNLVTDKSGVALLEFALVLPFLILLCLGGAEMTNYITTKMRISQLALQLADNAARIGVGAQLAAKTVSETDINDVMTGAQLSSGTLDLKKNGRIIISDLEPMATPNTSKKYKIGWQRCYGDQPLASTYGKAGATNMAGMGPAGQMATAIDDNATMFVEVHYVYTPLVGSEWMPSAAIHEIASMAVRDRRDLTKIYNDEKAPVASC